MFDDIDVDAWNPERDGRLEYTIVYRGPTVIKIRGKRVTKPTRILSSGIVRAIDWVGTEEVKVIKSATLHSVSLVSEDQAPHPSWRSENVETTDG